MSLVWSVNSSESWVSDLGASEKQNRYFQILTKDEEGHILSPNTMTSTVESLKDSGSPDVIIIGSVYTPKQLSWVEELLKKYSSSVILNLSALIDSFPVDRINFWNTLNSSALVTKSFVVVTKEHLEQLLEISLTCIDDYRLAAKRLNAAQVPSFLIIESPIESEPDRSFVLSIDSQLSWVNSTKGQLDEREFHGALCSHIAVNLADLGQLRLAVMEALLGS